MVEEIEQVTCPGRRRKGRRIKEKRTVASERED